MVAYHGSAEIKAKYVARVRAHMEADRIVQREGWTGGRGCAVGCTLEAYDHSRYPIELGVPVVLARLQDAIHEGLTIEEAKAWPLAFLLAIPDGADLSLVWPRFAVWMLRGMAAQDPSGSCERVAALYDRLIAGDPPSREKWVAASNAAARAVRDVLDGGGVGGAYAARAAYAAANYAADDADDARAAYAASAAANYAADDADDADAAWRSFWTAAAARIVELLAAAPVVGRAS